MKTINHHEKCDRRQDFLLDCARSDRLNLQLALLEITTLRGELDKLRALQTLGGGQWRSPEVPEQSEA